MSEQNKAPEALSDAWWNTRFQNVVGDRHWKLSANDLHLLKVRIAELESQQDALLEGQDQERLESPMPAPEQERRERQRRCNHAWRGKTPKCKWGKCTWVPFDGRIIRAYVDRRKSQPKPSASVEEIAERLAWQVHRGHCPHVSRPPEANPCPHPACTVMVESVDIPKITAAITEATAPLKAFSQSQSDALEHRDGQVVVLEAENARLAPLQESFNQCCDENARLREALEWFCERVDKGEVRSRRTYKQFKELLARTALKI